MEFQEIVLQDVFVKGKKRLGGKILFEWEKNVKVVLFSEDCYGFSILLTLGIFFWLKIVFQKVF